MKQQKTGLYILITYCAMQVSGAIFAPLLFKLFTSMEFKNPALLASGWWVFLGMGIATLITLLLVRKDTGFLIPLKGTQSTLLKTVGWGIIGFFLVFVGQGIAAKSRQHLV